MSDGEKVSKVLAIKRISLFAANRKLGFGAGNLHKLVKRGGNMHESSKEKFIRHFHVKRSWWETGEGEVFEIEPETVTLW